MKRRRRPMVLLAAVAVAALAGCGQRTDPDQPPEPTAREEASYALGAQIGSSLRRQPIDIDPEEVMRGIRDALAGRSEMSDADVVGVLQRYAYLREEAVANNRAGREFREQHRAREGVVTLPSGVQYLPLAAGSGPTLQAGDIALSWYAIDNVRGNRVASHSADDGEPAALAVEQILPGLREALLLMRRGDRWRIVLPPELAFGDAGADIGPNETIIVELEVVVIQRGRSVQ